MVWFQLKNLNETNHKQATPGHNEWRIDIHTSVRYLKINTSQGNSADLDKTP